MRDLVIAVIIILSTTILQAQPSLHSPQSQGVWQTVIDWIPGVSTYRKHRARTDRQQLEARNLYNEILDRVVEYGQNEPSESKPALSLFNRLKLVFIQELNQHVDDRVWNKSNYKVIVELSQILERQRWICKLGRVSKLSPLWGFISEPEIKDLANFMSDLVKPFAFKWTIIFDPHSSLEQKISDLSPIIKGREYRFRTAYNEKPVAGGNQVTHYLHLFPDSKMMIILYGGIPVRPISISNVIELMGLLSLYDSFQHTNFLDSFGRIRGGAIQYTVDGVVYDWSVHHIETLNLRPTSFANYLAENTNTDIFEFNPEAPPAQIATSETSSSDLLSMQDALNMENAIKELKISYVKKALFRWANEKMIPRELSKEWEEIRTMSEDNTELLKAKDKAMVEFFEKIELERVRARRSLRD